MVSREKVGRKVSRQDADDGSVKKQGSGRQDACHNLSGQHHGQNHQVVDHEESQGAPQYGEKASAQHRQRKEPVRKACQDGQQ